MIVNPSLFPESDLAKMLPDPSVCLPGMLRALAVVRDCAKLGRASLFWWRATGDLPHGFVFVGVRPRRVPSVVYDDLHPEGDRAKKAGSARPCVASGGCSR